MRASDPPAMVRALLCAFLLQTLGCQLVSGHAGHDHGGGGDHGDSSIVHLDNDNFDELVGATKGAIIEFYAPWCTHCKHLKPEFEKLAKTYLDSEDVMVAMLNAEMHPEFSYRFGVRGFPTIFWFPAGSQKPSAEYWGERSAMALMTWITEKSDEPNPDAPDPDEPDPDFDLTGTWLDPDGETNDIVQTGTTIVAKPGKPQHWSSAHGKIKGNEIKRMPFNTVVLSATISEDANTLDWSNGFSWTRMQEDDDEGDDDDDEAETDDGDDEAAATKAAGAEADAEDAAARSDARTAAAAADAAAAAAEREEPAAEEKAEEPATKKAEHGKAADKGKAKAAILPSQLKAVQDQLDRKTKEIEKKVAELKHKKNELAKKNKELMASRENSLRLETKLEEIQTLTSILYCAIGVLAVLLVFQCCRSAGSADDDDEWDDKRGKTRSLVSSGKAYSNMA